MEQAKAVAAEQWADDKATVGDAPAVAGVRVKTAAEATKKDTWGNE